MEYLLFFAVLREPKCLDENQTCSICNLKHLTLLNGSSTSQIIIKCSRGLEAPCWQGTDKVAGSHKDTVGACLWQGQPIMQHSANQGCCSETNVGHLSYAQPNMICWKHELPSRFAKGPNYRTNAIIIVHWETVNGCLLNLQQRNNRFTGKVSTFDYNIQ